MILLDVNVLVYARREETERHEEYRSWLEEQLDSEWITTDRDYARFPGVRCRHPLDR